MNKRIVEYDPVHSLHGNKKYFFNLEITEYLKQRKQYNSIQVKYYMDELEVLQDNPLHMAEATLVNNDDDEHVIIQTLTYSKTRCLLRSP